MLPEITPLSPKEEIAFQQWAQANRITDVDQPDSHYDYRGYWKEFGNKPIKFGTDHFTDTYKQHGHPTFSQESRYSKGAADGGMWVGENFQAQPKMATSNAIEQLLMQRRMGGQ